MTDFLTNLWEGAVFAVYSVVILVMIPFSGDSIEKIEHCVPQLEYTAGKDMVLIAFRPANKLWASRGYDPDDIIDTNEYYLRIETNATNEQLWDNQDEKALVFTVIPNETKLVLTGEATTKDPQGLDLIVLDTSYRVDLKAKLGDKTVNLGLGQLEAFNKTKNQQNIANNQLLKLNEYRKDSTKWECPLK